MKLCRTCGAPIEDEATFCPMCGAKVEDIKTNGETTILNNTSEETTVLNPNDVPSYVNVPQQDEPPKQKKKLGKGAIIAIVIVVVVIAIIVISSISSATKNNYIYDDSVTNNDNIYSEFSFDYDTGYTMSDNIFDYQVQIGNIIYQFPMSVEEFIKTGLSLDEYEDSNKKISSGHGTVVSFVYPDGSQLSGKIVNFSKNESSITDCHITGVSINYRTDIDIKFDPSQIKLAKGIKLNVSTIDEVKSAYGEPKEVRTGEKEYNDNNTYITYLEDVYNRIELTFNENDVLCAIDIENIEQPSNVVEVGPSEDVPQLVKNYKKPSELGENLTSGIFELEGNLYQLPLPLNELLESGWSIVESSASTIAGKNHEYVNISKENVQIDNICVQNHEEYEVPIKYGIIEKIDTTSFPYGKDGSLIIAKGVDLNTNASVINSVFETANAVKEEKGDGRYNYKVSGNNIDVNVCVENKKVSYIAVYWNNN